MQSNMSFNEIYGILFVFKILAVAAVQSSRINFFDFWSSRTSRVLIRTGNISFSRKLISIKKVLLNFFSFSWPLADESKGAKEISIFVQ